MSQQGWQRYLSTAGWMLLLGVLAIYYGARGTSAWAQVSSSLRLYSVISLVAGMALLTGGALRLWSKSRQRWGLLSGLAAALTLGVNHGVALWLNVIPCRTPG